MKRPLALLLIALVLLLPPAALAAEDGFAVGEMGDGVQRAQLRLRELGYLAADDTGVWRDGDAAAFAAYRQNGGQSDALFSSDAPRAAVKPEENADENRMIYGGKMPWSEVKNRLVSGKSYGVTDCRTGIILYLVFTGGDGLACVRPELSWDNATMVGLFSGMDAFDTRPVVIALDGMLVAASLRLNHAMTGDDGLTPAWLYFAGSGTGLGGIADRAHSASLETAATQP